MSRPRNVTPLGQGNWIATKDFHVHSCIVAILSATVAGTAAFCITRPALPFSRPIGTQQVDDVVHELGIEHAETLWQLLMTTDGDADTRQSRSSREVLPQWRSFLSDGQVLPGHADLLFVWLQQGGARLGVAGVTRRERDEPFRPDDRHRLESIGTAVSNMVALQNRCDELQRREVVTRAIPALAGTYCVVDEDRQRIVWTCSTDDSISEDEVWAHEESLLDIAFRSKWAKWSRNAIPLDEPIPSYPSLDCGQIVKVIELGAQPIFGAQRCSLVALTAAPKGSSALSPRERQIAHLLSAGYTNMNAAAILSVSEHTIRTYVRRVYRKLNVTSRTDLARKCASNYGNGQYIDT